MSRERITWLCPNGCEIHGGEEPPGHFCRRTPRLGRHGNRHWIVCHTKVTEPNAPGSYNE